MKHIILIATLIISTCINGSDFEESGKINFFIPQLGQGVISIDATTFLMNRQPYANGGLTFTYQTPFNYIPRVLVTLELASNASPTTTYSAVISSNSTSAVTVLVYRITNGGIVTEAASNEILVTIFAVDNFN